MDDREILEVPYMARWGFLRLQNSDFLQQQYKSGHFLKLENLAHHQRVDGVSLGE